MGQANKHWASGNWQVGEGKAEEFIDRWREFLTWTKEANDGFVGARLVRDLRSPNHFLSFASWQDLDSIKAWQGKPEFAQRFSACRALCEDMQSSVYELAVDI